MHLIQQHTFDFQCSSQEFGKEIHGQLSSLLEREFYPQLEILFDKYSSDKCTLAVDALEIELPAISQKYWKEELVQKSLAQIETYLKQHQIFDPIANHDVNRNVISNKNHAQNILFQFLITGKINENGISRDLDKLVSQIELNDIFIEKLFSIFESNRQTLIRWIFSIPDFFKAKLIKNLDGFINEKIEFKIKVRDVKVESILHKQWLEFVRFMIYLENKANTKDAIFRNFIEWSNLYFDIKPQVLIVISQVVRENNNSTPIKMFFNNFIEWFNKHFYEKQHVYNKASQVVLEDNLDLTIFPKEMKDEAQNESLYGEDLYENRYFIHNAGLVILHPFFQTLFKQLNLCDAHGAWITHLAQHKAILLTQYLIDGSEKIQESDLILNKILCGFNIDEVVNVQLEISKEEKDKCQSLLEAVLEHWTTMSKSSIEALRESFLIREAKLDLSKLNSYELWVEEKGFDVLLAQLPWGIGMVKTPWMEHFLTCNWA